MIFTTPLFDVNYEIDNEEKKPTNWFVVPWERPLKGVHLPLCGIQLGVELSTRHNGAV